MALRRPRSACELRRREVPQKISWPGKADPVGPRYHATLAPKAEVLKVGEGWKAQGRPGGVSRSSKRIPTPQAVTPKQRPFEDCLVDAAVRRSGSFRREARSESTTCRGENSHVLPGLAELQKSNMVFERWSCFPELQTQLRPSRATALSLHKVLQEPQADVEMELVGRVEVEKRRLLLLWCMGCCLELLGLLDPAAALFAKCTAIDVGNPVHAFNRGVVLLRLHQWQAASRDFDLAANHCLARGWLLPPMLLVRRALANLHLGRMPEVWADFELARLRSEHPDFTMGQLQRQFASKGITSYASYCRALTGPPMTRLRAHRHWVVQALAGQKLPGASEAIQRSLLELLQTVPGFAHLELAQVAWDAISMVLLRGGQPLLPPDSDVFILFSGELRVLRFARALLAAESLQAPAYLEEEMILSAPSSLCGLQGRQRDGWLVAEAKGASLLQITMEGMQRMC